MHSRTLSGGLSASPIQLVGLAVASGLSLISMQDRRVLVGCSLLILGLLVLGSKSRD